MYLRNTEEGGESGKRTETEAGEQRVCAPRRHGFDVFPTTKLVLSCKELPEKVSKRAHTSHVESCLPPLTPHEQRKSDGSMP